MKNTLFLSAVLLLNVFTMKAQDLYVGDVSGYPADMRSVTVFNGDTVVHITNYVFTCVDQRTFANAKEKAKWDKLKRDVKKAYPYSVLAKMKLAEMDAQLALVKGEKAREDFSKKCEDELVKQFESDMRNLTANQGRILFKLLDRETGSTTYQIIKQRRGSFSAFMWQSVAIVFGNNLKSDYDPTGDDANIESIVQQIELGLI